MDEKLEELPNLTVQLQEKQVEIDNMVLSRAEEMEQLEKEKDELKKKLRGKNEEIVNLSLEKEEMMQSLEELDNQHEEAMQHVINMKDQLAKSNEDYKKKIGDLELEVQSLKSQQMLNQAVESSSSNELNHQIAELKDEIQDMHEKLDKQESHLNILQNENQTKDGKIKEMTDKMAASAGALNDLHMDKQELQEKIASLKQDMAKQAEKVKSLREENDRLRSDVTTSKSEELVQQSSSHEILKLEEENNDMKIKLDNVQAKLKEATKEGDQMKSKLDELNKKCESLTNNLEQKNGEVNRLTNELNGSEKEICEVKEKLSLVSSDCARLQRESDRMHGDCESFSTHTHVVEKELSALKKEYASKETENSELTSQVEIFSNQLLLLKDNLVAKNDECDKLSNELKQSRDLLQDTTDRLHSKCEENNELSQAIETYRAQILEIANEKEAEYDARLLSATGELVLVKEELANKSEECQRLNAEIYLRDEQISELKAARSSLQDEINDYKKEIESMQKQSLECEKTSNEARTRLNELDNQQHSLTNENERLKTELSAINQKLESQVAHYESYIDQLKTSKDTDTSTLQQQFDEMLDKDHKKDLHISELEAKITNSYSQIQECQKELEGAIEKSEALQNVCDRYKRDITSLEESVSRYKSENVNLFDQVKKLELSVSEISQLQDHIQTLESDRDALKRDNDMFNTKISSLNEDNLKLRETIQDLEGTVNAFKNQELQNLQLAENENKEKNVLNEKVLWLETEKQRLSSLLNETESNIDVLNKQNKQYIQEIESLKQLCVQKDKEISEIKLNPSKPDSKNDIVHDETDKGVVQETVEKVHQVQLLGAANGSLDYENDQHKRDVAIEIDRLKGQLEEKDSVISELQRNNASLLKMLDAKAKNSGDTSHVELLNLENEVKVLKKEREQMMDVLNEKSRESSNLKSELQRLMNVVAAQKTALEKLQKDNHDLSKKSPDKDGARIDDMQKEVVQNLSRIIRDKDLEIESLTQKNQTLLSVLQESSNEGTHINSLMQDKDNLTKQLSALQSEREQMIAYLNQKHQESVAYHTEVQRLTALLISENENNEKIKNEYELLKPQFEDKKQALVKTQNELLNYKQKYQELEMKCGQLIQQSGSDETVDKGIYEAKVHEAEKLQERHNDLMLATKEKEMKIQTLHQQISDLEQNLRVTENERSGYKKQVDNFTFQLHGIQTEHGDLKSEVAQLTQQKEALSSESHGLKEMNNKLALQVQDSSFQIQSLQEKVRSLTAVLQEQQGEKGQLQTVIQENEVTQNQIRQLAQERDQALLRLQHKDEENIKLQKEVWILRILSYSD